MKLNFKLNDKEYKVEPNFIKNSKDYVYIKENELITIVKYFHNKNEYDLNDFLYMNITDDFNNIYFINNMNSDNLYLRYMETENKTEKKEKQQEEKEVILYEKRI